MNPLIFLLLWHLAPLSGLATWYDSGDIMRNGETLRLSAHTVAVDASHVDWLDRDVVILTECGEVHFARITDTGLLYNAGYFRLGIGPLDRLRYWPATTPAIKWKEDTVHKVVADFPRDFFLNEVACNGDETLKVRMFIWQSQ